MSEGRGEGRHHACEGGRVRCYPVPSGALAAIIDHLRSGGVAIVPCPGAGRVIRLDGRALARFERAGAWLLRESGEGYRLRQGRGSVYLHTSHLLTVGVDLRPVEVQP